MQVLWYECAKVGHFALDDVGCRLSTTKVAKLAQTTKHNHKNTQQPT